MVKENGMVTTIEHQLGILKPRLSKRNNLEVPKMSSIQEEETDS